MVQFLKNMWAMHRIDEAYLELAVQKGRITHEQAQEIVSMPKQ